MKARMSKRFKEVSTTKEGEIYLRSLLSRDVVGFKEYNIKFALRKELKRPDKWDSYTIYI